MLIQGNCAPGSVVNACGLTSLRLAGTTVEDLEAVDSIALGLAELEVAPTDFEAPPGVQEEVEDFIQDELQLPRLHVAPNPARFLALQRFQARLGTDSLVILGSFAKALPALRRLGTVETSPAELHERSAWLPPSLEECVLSIVGAHAGDPSICGVRLSSMPPAECRRLHLCFSPDDEDDGWGHIDGLLQEAFCLYNWAAASVTLMGASVRSPPAESTPLCCPIARGWMQHG